MLPLSAAQRRMLFLHELHQDVPAYNVAVCFRIDGRLDTDALRSAVQDVVERHQALRTIFPSGEGMLKQRVLSAVAAADVFELRAVAPEAIGQQLTKAAGHLFDLGAEPQFKALLLRSSPQRHHLLLTLHHIAVDEESMQIVLHDLESAYSSRLRGTRTAWSTAAVQQADFIRWQTSVIGSPQDPTQLCRREVAHWKKVLASLPERRRVGSDRVGPPEPSYRGDRVSTALPAGLWADLKSATRPGGATPFMVMTAAIAVVLGESGAGPDIAFGVPITQRSRKELEAVVGLLTNTVVLRVDTSAAGDFAELVAQVRSAALDAYSNSTVPFEQVVAAVRPGTAEVDPLFHAMLAFTAADAPSLRLAGLITEHVKLPMGVSRFDLTFYVTENRAPRQLSASIAINYSTDLFDRETVEQLGQRLVALLEAVVGDPKTPLGRFARRPVERSRRQLSPRPAGGTTVVEMFLEQVARTPDATAVISAAGVLSYAELNASADRLAGRMLDLGIGPEDVVALVLPRSAAVIVAMLGVLKAGASYLPVDPGYPAERIAFLLDDAQPRLVVSAGQIDASLFSRMPPVLTMEEMEEAPNPAPVALVNQAAAGNAAYVIYTSGSTGRPKGVVVEHRALANYVDQIRREYRGVAGRSILHSSMSFDATITTLYPPLAAGGSIVVSALDEEELAACMTDGVDFVKVTPSQLPMLALLPDHYLPRGELMFGGEALHSDVVRAWREKHPDQRIVNHFGPTETTVGCFHHRLDAQDPLPPDRVPIGRPMDGVGAYVLDDRLRPVPPGGSGELYIAGAGLARGYLRRPALTSQRFVADPFGPPRTRMYRTGDLVRRRTDGDLEFLGRVDQQVKIRGFRIEPAEIELALGQLPGVAEAAVVVGKGPNGQDQLQGYLRPLSEVELDPAVVTAELAQHLPSQLIPTTMTVLDSMPLTPHGKLDRRALVTRAAARRGADSMARPITPGVTGGLVEVLCELFAECLGLEAVDPDDDFFLAGGDSLLAVELIHRARQHFGTQIPLRILLRNASPVAFAEALETGAGPARANASGGRRIQIQQRGPLQPSRSGDARAVLLTGATGYFGSFLLAELLATTSLRVHTLVRAHDDTHARRRLRSTFDRYGLEPAGWSDRVGIVLGDLADPRLGLDESAYDVLGDQIDVVLHSAAEVNAFLPRERLWSTNVAGTGELLQLAVTRRSKAFHLASTTSVTATVRSGYADSKHDAELLVRTQQDAGLLATISRLPRLSAATGSGRYNDNDIVHRALRTVLQIGAAPDIEFRETWLPVDLAASAFLAAVLDANGSRALTFAAGTEFSLRAFLRTAGDLGFQVEPMPFEDWARLMEQKAGIAGELAVEVLGGKASRAGTAESSAADRFSEEFEQIRIDDQLEAVHRSWLERLAGQQTVKGSDAEFE